jgi:hypothetical protein
MRYSRSIGPSAARPSPSRSGARETRQARTFELHVTKLAAASSELAEKDGASIAQLRHETAKLMPGVGHCDRIRILGQSIS